MGHEEQGEKTAEELEADENQPDRTEETSVGEVASVLDRESEPLQQGRKLDSPLGPLPVRSLAAMAAMVVVAVVVYLIAWALFGTLGLVLGWIPAAALGLLAAREVGKRAA